MKSLKDLYDLETQFISQMEKIRKDSDFGEKITHCYNPLSYAKEMYYSYLKKYAQNITNYDQTINNNDNSIYIEKKNLFLGMNPGPFGMMQTGIPFGEINAVKKWLKINAPINKPKKTHPRRPILGLECERSEISGKRFWGLFEKIFITPNNFFKTNFVYNYCPLAFLSKTGSNITPDKIPINTRKKIEQICDDHLGKFIKIIKCQNLIGIGLYAEKAGLRIKKKFNLNIKINRILHPSPASPKANRGWDKYALEDIKKYKIWDS